MKFIILISRAANPNLNEHCDIFKRTIVQPSRGALMIVSFLVYSPTCTL